MPDETHQSAVALPDGAASARSRRPARAGVAALRAARGSPPGTARRRAAATVLSRRHVSLRRRPFDTSRPSSSTTMSAGRPTPMPARWGSPSTRAGTSPAARGPRREALQRTQVSHRVHHCQRATGQHPVLPAHDAVRPRSRSRRRRTTRHRGRRRRSRRSRAPPVGAAAHASSTTSGARCTPSTIICTITPARISAAPTMPGSRWLNGRIALNRCVTVRAPRSNAADASAAVASLWPHETVMPGVRRARRRAPAHRAAPARA